MTHSDQLLGALVTAYLLARARKLASLRPAATACAAFVLLDAARLTIDLARSPESPWWLAWVDVAIVVAMPGCWAGLLLQRSGHECGEVATSTGLSKQSGGVTPETQPRALLQTSVCVAKEGLQAPRVVSPREGFKAICDVIKLIHSRILPALILLAYAAVLLATRHQPAVLAHWYEALQAPRLVVGAWALWVALAWRSVGPATKPTPGVSIKIPHESATLDPVGESFEPSTCGTGDVPGLSDLLHAPSLPPSTAIGVVLALGAAASVVGGLWPTWGAVRALSLLSWALVAAVAWRAK